MYKTIPFDTNLFDFVKLFKDLFETEDLESLNEHHEGLFQVSDDSKTSFHTKFYDKYRDGWTEMQNLYDAFVKHICIKQGDFGDDILYQKFPTVRFHIPGNVAVGAFHKDADFNHPQGEVNFIIPITNSDGNASVWVETEVDSEVFEPMHLVVGGLIEFNGNKLTHGNKVNDTGKTRVSMDFRILPYSEYVPNEENTSMTKGTKFKEGEYYNRLKLTDEILEDMKGL